MDRIKTKAKGKGERQKTNTDERQNLLDRGLQPAAMTAQSKTTNKTNSNTSGSHGTAQGPSPTKSCRDDGGNPDGTARGPSPIIYNDREKNKSKYSDRP